MNVNKYKVLSIISLLVTVFYGVINLIAIIFLNLSLNNEVANRIFTLDVLSWHIYGIFAIVTLIIKFVKDKKINLNIIAHTILMVMSFIEIYYLFLRGF